MRNELDDSTVLAATDADVASSLPSSSTSPVAPAAKPRIVEDVLIEEVSIDGMCGVY